MGKNLNFVYDSAVLLKAFIVLLCSIGLFVFVVSEGGLPTTNWDTPNYGGGYAPHPVIPPEIEKTVIGTVISKDKVSAYPSYGEYGFIHLTTGEKFIVFPHTCYNDINVNSTYIFTYKEGRQDPTIQSYKCTGYLIKIEDR